MHEAGTPGAAVLPVAAVAATALRSAFPDAISVVSTTGVVLLLEVMGMCLYLWWQGGNRLLTVLIYLSAAKVGGETYFMKIGKKFTAKRVIMLFLMS